MIPTRFLIILTTLWTFSALAMTYYLPARVAWVVIGIILFIVTAIDLFQAFRLPKPEINREVSLNDQKIKRSRRSRGQPA